VIYRRIDSADIAAVERFAMRGLRSERVPMHLSRERVRAVIEHFARSQTDFHMGAFDGNEMVGGIAVTVVPMLFFERSEAHIVMLFATAPGVGFRLLRAAMTWAQRNPAVRRVLWSLEDDADHDRMERAARRYGFTKRHALVVAYKE
jgi:RimJ/RimL family protein N-acetyltransferase